MTKLEQQVRDAVNHIRRHVDGDCLIGLILGSGLGAFADQLSDAVRLPTPEIPHYPKSTVEGHAGELVIGRLHGKRVAAFKGRVHYYEGYSMTQVTFGVRILAQLGIDTLIVTNAAGGVNRLFEPGDLMLMTGHVNFFFDNPLRGPNVDAWGPRFPDMSAEYDESLIALAESIAREQRFPIRRGVYWGGMGPSYETPAEVRMVAALGGDAVGMSSVPEVTVARHHGIRVLGISCITNKAAGLSSAKLSHVEVTETADRVKERFQSLLGRLIREIQ